MLEVYSLLNLRHERVVLMNSLTYSRLSFPYTIEDFSIKAFAVTILPWTSKGDISCFGVMFAHHFRNRLVTNSGSLSPRVYSVIYWIIIVLSDWVITSSYLTQWTSRWFFWIRRSSSACVSRDRKRSEIGEESNAVQQGNSLMHSIHQCFPNIYLILPFHYFRYIIF